MDIVKNLSGPWSSVAGLLTHGSIDDVEKIWQSAGMEEPQKARLVVSPLFMRKADLEALHSSLMKLHDVASRDTSEWVHMLSIAVDGYDGRIHTDKVMEKIPSVREDIDRVVQLAQDIDPALYRPLEEQYLTDGVLEAMGLESVVAQRQQTRKEDQQHENHSHFRVRERTTNIESVVAVAPKAHSSDAQGTSGFDIPLRKRPHTVSQAGSVPLMKKSRADTSSLFLKPSKPKGLVGKMPQKKKAAVLDISALEKARKANEERQEKLQRQKEEEKEKEAQARAEAHEAEKKANEERKQILKEAAKRKKEEQKQKEREEKQKAIEEKKAQRKDERKQKRPKQDPVRSEDVALALERARLKADMESTKEIENPSAFDTFS